jgi:electron transfer flavoprotein alpha subunit
LLHYRTGDYKRVTYKPIINVFLNGLSQSFAAAAGAVRSFLAAHPALKVAKHITLIKDPGDMERLSGFLGQLEDQDWLVTERFQPEKCLDIFAEYDQDLALFPPGVFGSEMAGRLAARQGGQAILNLSELSIEADGSLVAYRWAYSQNLKAGFRLNGRPLYLSLSKEWSGRSDEPTVIAGTTHQGATMLRHLPSKNPPHLISCQEHLRQTAGDLSQAKTLVVGGYGLGGPDGVDALESLARALGADWGVSRPVVMNAWAPMERLIGVSGTMTSPRWALVLGASGAAALFSGLARAAHIASVNTDPLALATGQSDLAVVGEARAIIGELIAALDAKKAHH